MGEEAWKEVFLHEDHSLKTFHTEWNRGDCDWGGHRVEQSFLYLLFKDKCEINVIFNINLKQIYYAFAFDLV